MKRNIGQSNRTASLHRLILGTVILLFGLLLGGSLLTLGVLYFGLRPYAVWEYGEGVPEISVFAPNRSATYVDRLPEKPEIGLHTVRIEAEGVIRIVFLKIRDTKAPTAIGTEKTISTKTALQPTDLIEKLADADKVWVDFIEKPPFGTVGDYAVTIVMQDVTGNRSEVESLLHIRMANDAGVTIEAGDDAPSPNDFLTDVYDASFVTELTDEMLHTPGAYPIDILADGERCTSMLTVVDTAAPVLETRMVLCEPGETVTPEDFIEQLSDGSAVTLSFVKAPDPDLRDFQQVTIRATDVAGNVTEASAGLLFTHAQPIAVEARDTAVTADECLSGVSYAYATLVHTFIPNKPGLYAATLYVDGKTELAIVEVKDTVAPVLEVSSSQWYLEHPIEAVRLCSVQDYTETTVEYVEPVDWTLPLQTVTVRAVDAGGNESVASFELMLVEDMESPVLYGVGDRTFYLDEPFMYRTGVSAVDNADGEIEVMIDTSAVTANKAGSYRVTYSATDSVGLTVSQTVTVKVVKSTTNLAQLDQYVKKVTDELFKEGMSLYDRVYAIYRYVFDNFKYVGRKVEHDWRKEALYGLKYKKGDCYTANAVAHALLEAAGAEVLEVSRHNSSIGNHYWLLVNIGTGWYHFDAHRSWEHGYKCFMWTDAQCSVVNLFWKYDKDGVPLIATTPFSIEDAKAVEEEWMKTHPIGG